MHPAELDSATLLGECRITHTRRKGPGGQHRNKVETAVVLLHQPTGVMAEANEKRSQAENKRVALDRLRRELALQVRTDPGSAPGTRLEARLRGGKLSINPKHDDFPIVLAEILDRLHQAHYEIPPLARQLQITNSQILKFLKLHPPAFDKFNREREVRHLPRIKF